MECKAEVEVRRWNGGEVVRWHGPEEVGRDRAVEERQRTI